jgi:hypothetical protein
MKKTIFKFGLISGVISSVSMLATVPFEDKIGLDHSYLLGYTIIVLSFLMVFFGVRSYRDNAGQGQITFSKAFLVGLSISLITCVFYVATWEALYFTVMHDYMDKYAAAVIHKAQLAGDSPAAIQAQVVQLQKYKVLYENPFYNVAMTFIEPFPVGLLITLLTAAILRKKPKAQAMQTPLAAID